MYTIHMYVVVCIYVCRDILVVLCAMVDFYLVVDLTEKLSYHTVNAIVY